MPTDQFDIEAMNTDLIVSMFMEVRFPKSARRPTL